ncbi:MAG: metal-dependent hydrolase [bacterium]|nr:metal-dependent hydrolase [bacterium]
MLGITHLLFAVVFAFLFVNIFSFSHPIIFFLLFCFAALLPDVDHPGSTLGRKIWPLSSVISFFFGHRGFLHSIFVPLGFLALGYYLDVFWIGAAIAGGYCAHLVSDALTLSGIRPFWLGPKVRGIVKTGGLLEMVFFFLMLVFFVWLFVETV